MSRPRLSPTRFRAFETVLAASLLLVASSVHGSAGGAESKATEAGYTYYGFVPREIWAIEAAKMCGHDTCEFRVNNRTVMDRSLVVVVGNHDDTRVKVYSLPSGELVGDFVLDVFEEATVSLPNGSFFKVVSDRPATVLLMGGWAMEQGQAFGSTFFTSSSGGYVGKEFFFKAVQAKNPPYALGLPFKVIALEDADVTVFDVKGSKSLEFRLSANRVREVSFTPLAVYKLVSTGNVMLQAWAGGTCFYPSTDGSFVGRIFYGAACPVDWWPGYSPPTYVTTGLEDSHLTIYDLEYTRKYGEPGLASMSNTSVQIEASSIALESTKPIMLMMHGNNGLSFAGLKADQTALLHIPLCEATAGEAYLYAYTDTTVTLDDVQLKLHEDGVLPIEGGLHKVWADKNVLIEVVNWAAPSEIYFGTRYRMPSFNRISDFAACIPAAQSIGMEYTGLALKPVLGQDIPWLYVGVAAAFVGAAAVFVFMRRGGKP